MRQINGNLSLMSVMDILQWGENCKRSGTLILSMKNQEKRFYLQEGKIIFVWSDCQGERIVDFMKEEIAINQTDLANAFTDSNNLDIPLLGYFLSKGLVSKERLEEILLQIAQTALTDALQWGSGEFKFTDELPGIVTNGPVKLSSSQVMLESVKVFDEAHLSSKFNATVIADEIRNRILQNDFELPPMPDIMQKVMEKINDPTLSIDDIVECITDQMLISKILKICNSPFYRKIGSVETLKEAVLFIGLKSLMSIIAVHALSNFSPKNESEIKKVLQHSLLCGMIARQLAQDMRSNREQAFICGLMHNIGKTIMLEIFEDYELPEDAKIHLLEEHYAEIGYLLAKKWNFSEDIQEVIHYHNRPEKAEKHHTLVEIVYLANMMAQATCDPAELAGHTFNSIDIRQLDMNCFIEQLDDLDREATSIVNM